MTGKTIEQTSLKFIWEEYYLNGKTLKQIKKEDGDLMGKGLIDQVVNRPEIYIKDKRWILSRKKEAIKILTKKIRPLQIRIKKLK